MSSKSIIRMVSYAGVIGCLLLTSFTTTPVVSVIMSFFAGSLFGTSLLEVMQRKIGK